MSGTCDNVSPVAGAAQPADNVSPAAASAQPARHQRLALGEDSDDETSAQKELLSIASPIIRRSSRLTYESSPEVVSISPKKRKATDTTANDEGAQRRLNMDDGEESNAEEGGKKPIATVFTPESPKYVHNGKEHLTYEEMEEALLKIAGKECGLDRDGCNGNELIPKDWKTIKKDGNRRRICYCTYHVEAKCNWRVEVIEVRGGNMNENVQYYHIRVGSVKHCDHHYSTKRTRGLPKMYAEYLESSKDSPQDVVDRILLRKHKIDSKMIKTIKRFVTRSKARHRKKGKPTGMDINSWENLQKQAEKHIRTEVEKRNNVLRLGDHTPYLAGEFVIEPEATKKDSRVVIVLSTRNLLLNAVRQRECGMGMAFHVDASYKCTVDQHFGLLPIITSAPSQTGHLVATAIVNKEDEEAHKTVFDSIKKEIERIMNELMDDDNEDAF